MDAHVGRAMFENCIVHDLSGKTRILVTHQLQYMPLVDMIVVLKDGEIVELGTYEELMKVMLASVNRMKGTLTRRIRLISHSLI